uniref:Uncharacterized protein n=1 Tax=Opuntia streptacantha TaxID=393608 RepID=A0A7C8ZCC9_OPUST
MSFLFCSSYHLVYSFHFPLESMLYSVMDLGVLQVLHAFMLCGISPPWSMLWLHSFVDWSTTSPKHQKAKVHPICSRGAWMKANGGFSPQDCSYVNVFNLD